MTTPRSLSLHDAILNNDESKFHAFLTKESSNQICLKRNVTPLQLAAREGSMEMSLCLLQANADIDGKHDNFLVEKKTPFYLAVERGHFLLASIFLACGADEKKALRLADELKEKEIENQIGKNFCQTHYHFFLIILEYYSL